MDLDGSIYRITTIFFSITDRKRGMKEKKEKDLLSALLKVIPHCGECFG